MPQSRPPNDRPDAELPRPRKYGKRSARIDADRPKRAELRFESGRKEYERVFGGHTVSMGIYRCQQCSPDTGAEQATRTHNINVPFGGLYVKHVGKRRIPIDTHRAAFYNSGQPYHTSHPAGGGDWGAYLSVRDDVLMEILAPLDPSATDRRDRPFVTNHGPLSPTQLLHAHSMGAAAMKGELSDSLETEEELLRLFASIVQAADRDESFESQARSTGSVPDRDGRKRSHRDLAFHARNYIAAHFTESLTLDSIAQAVDSSPYHLCRVFKTIWGETLHGYQQGLRLREALARLHDSTLDLTRLALDLGYSNHSHFTARFRRAFGVAPSVVRRSFQSPRQAG